MLYVNGGLITLKIILLYLSILLGGTVIYLLDSYIIFYCVTVLLLFMPPTFYKKRHLGCFQFCYHEQRHFCVSVPCWTLDSALLISHRSTLQPMLCASFQRALLKHAPWLEFRGAPQSTQRTCFTGRTYGKAIQLYDRKRKTDQNGEETVVTVSKNKPLVSTLEKPMSVQWCEPWV